MAVMKKAVRKKLSKTLARLVKKHGAEMTLALVTGIVSSLAADKKTKAERKAGKEVRAVRRARAASIDKAEIADRSEVRTAAVRRIAKPLTRPLVVRKRAQR